MQPTVVNYRALCTGNHRTVRRPRGSFRVNTGHPFPRQMAASVNLPSKVATADRDVDLHQAGKVTEQSEEVSGLWQISVLTSRVPEAGDEGENLVSCGLPGSVVANFLTWKEGSFALLPCPCLHKLQRVS